MISRTCNSLICNKYFHLLKNMTFHLQEAVDIHNIEDMWHAIVFQQLIDKIDPKMKTRQTKD